MARVSFRIGETEVRSEWNDSATAAKIVRALPVESSGNYWGSEFYFPVPVKAGPSKHDTDVVEAGTIAYWPAGSCVCIFWGPTPASEGGECRAASPVTVLGRVLNPEVLPKLKARKVSMTSG